MPQVYVCLNTTDWANLFVPHTVKNAVLNMKAEPLAVLDIVALSTLAEEWELQESALKIIN